MELALYVVRLEPNPTCKPTHPKPHDKSGPGWIHPVLNHATRQLILVISANRVGSVEDVPVVACCLH